MKEAPRTNRYNSQRRLKIGIVASLYNSEYVNALVEAAEKELKNHEVIIKRVPGAFEIPLEVKKLLQKKDVKGVITLGVIWQGQTAHADLIGQTVTEALMMLMIEFEKPVIHEVLMVKNEHQAKERCMGKKLNRGKEAAEAVLHMLGESKIVQEKSKVVHQAKIAEESKEPTKIKKNRETVAEKRTLNRKRKSGNRPKKVKEKDNEKTDGEKGEGRGET